MTNSNELTVATLSMNTAMSLFDVIVADGKASKVVTDMITKNLETHAAAVAAGHAEELKISAEFNNNTVELANIAFDAKDEEIAALRAEIAIFRAEATEAKRVEAAEAAEIKRLEINDVCAY